MSYRPKKYHLKKICLKLTSLPSDNNVPGVGAVSDFDQTIPSLPRVRTFYFRTRAAGLNREKLCSLKSYF